MKITSKHENWINERQTENNENRIFKDDIDKNQINIPRF